MVAQEKAQFKRFNSDIVPGVNDMEVLSPSQTLYEFTDSSSPHSFPRYCTKPKN